MSKAAPSRGDNPVSGQEAQSPDGDVRADADLILRALDYDGDYLPTANVRDGATAAVSRLLGSLTDARHWRDEYRELADKLESRAVGAEAALADAQRERDAKAWGAEWQYEMGKKWRGRAIAAEARVETLQAALGCAEYALMTGAHNDRDEALALARAALRAAGGSGDKPT